MKFIVCTVLTGGSLAIFYKYENNKTDIENVSCKQYQTYFNRNKK